MTELKSGAPLAGATVSICQFFSRHFREIPHNQKPGDARKPIVHLSRRLWRVETGVSRMDSRSSEDMCGCLVGGTRMKLCPIALSGCVAFCFVIVALWVSTYHTAEKLNRAVSDAGLTSVELFHWSQSVHTQHSNMENLVSARRSFRDAHQRLVDVFASGGWPDEPFYSAPASTVAAFLTISKPPDDVMAIWRRNDEHGSIDMLMAQQFSVCQDLCSSPTLSPERRAEDLAALNRIAVGSLIPRLRELRDATTAWKDSVRFYVRCALFVAAALMVGAVIFTRLRIVAPLLDDLDTMNTALKGRNSQLEAMVADRTKDLRKAFEEVTSAHEARTRFLASINHEMRTPLNGVLGVAALLRKSDLSASQVKLVETIVHSGTILIRLIDDVLDYVSLASGRMELTIQPIDLKAQLQAALDLISPLAVEKRLNLRVEWSSGDWAPVLGDPERLHQIVNNVVGNALKFTESGHVTVRFDQTIIDNEVQATLEVIDTGPGISDEKKKRLFVPFERRALGIPTQGTGLGLAITKSLVDQMGGTIELESEPGAGTYVCIRLSFDPVEQGTVADAA